MFRCVCAKFNFSVFETRKFVSRPRLPKHHICGVAMVARAKMISVDLCRIKLKGGFSSLQIREFCFKLLSVGIDQGFSCRGTKVRGFAMQLQLLFIV